MADLSGILHTCSSDSITGSWFYYERYKICEPYLRKLVFEVRYSVDFSAGKRAELYDEVQRIWNEPGFEVLFEGSDENCKSVQGLAVHGEVRPSRVVINYRIRGTSIELRLSGASQTPIRELGSKLSSRLKQFTDSADERIREVRTSYYAEQTANTHTTQIFCLPWEEIRTNYTKSVATQLDTTMNFGVDVSGGRLMIWYGAPGTGKTYAIRALIYALRATHSVVNVSDVPEFLLRSDYYYGLLDESKPILFILEDAADSLIRSTRAKNEPSISRILNLTDGLVAEGRNDLFLVSFNEALEELDPAIVRPGRCNQIVKFSELSKDEASEWLKVHDCELTDKAKKTYSLAELYSALHNSGKMVKRTTDLSNTRSIGFGQRYEYYHHDAISEE